MMLITKKFEVRQKRRNVADVKKKTEVQAVQGEGFLGIAQI